MAYNDVYKIQQVVISCEDSAYLCYRKDASTDAFHACGEDTPVKEYQCSGLGCRPRVRGRCPVRAEGEVMQEKIIYV